MNCQDYDIELGDYVDGTLEARAHAGFSTHLATCARCQTLVADLTALR